MPEANITMAYQGQYFTSQELLATRPTPKLENHHLSAVRNCLFNILTATLHIGGCSSICNPRMCHAVMTGSYSPIKSVSMG